MKKKINICLLLTFIALFMVACSESDDVMPLNEQNVETRAEDSPLLVASPTELYFNTSGLQTRTDTVNIKTAGLSSLAMLTRFEVTVQGPDADNFTPFEPEISLSNIIQSLLGNGVDIPVEFYSVREGEHEAELLITASLLGVLMPVQITIPLHATVASGPRLIGSVPEFRGIATFDGRIPGADDSDIVPQGQYHVDLIFDRNVSLTSGSAATFDPIAVPSVIVGQEIVNGNTLRIYCWAYLLGEGARHFLSIPEGVVIDENLGINEDFSFQYTYVGPVPDEYI